VQIYWKINLINFIELLGFILYLVWKSAVIDLSDFRKLVFKFEDLDHAKFLRLLEQKEIQDSH
jgi:hypothetical protein